jgi:hypothetical protein
MLAVCLIKTILGREYGINALPRDVGKLVPEYMISH